jgi:hypothetical protein
MPESYEIDPQRELIVCRAWGEFSNADLRGHYRRLASDPAFSPQYRQLGDLRDVTAFSVDSATIAAEAHASIFARGTRRAFVAPKGLAYGLARMFVAHASAAGQVMEVFTERDVAEQWLGL